MIRVLIAGDQPCSVEGCARTDASVSRLAGRRARLPCRKREIAFGDAASRKGP